MKTKTKSVKRWIVASGAAGSDRNAQAMAALRRLENERWRRIGNRRMSGWK